MATLQLSGPVCNIPTGANIIKLTGASAEEQAGGVLVQLVGTTLSGLSITVSGQSHAIEVAGATDVIKPIVYRSIYVNGAVGTGAYVTTAITTDSIIFIPSCGMTPVLNVTAFTSGTLIAYITPIVGSAAI
jgi:hypothetical protein